MRQIVLRNVGYPGKTNYIKFNMYYVFLGNDVKNYFTNLKDAKQFLADTNRFMNLKLFEFNQVYISIFNEYQQNWFYFDNSYRNTDNGSHQIEDKITRNILGIAKAMKFMSIRSGSTNGNYTTFTNFFNCLDYSGEIINNLRNVLDQKDQNLSVKRLDTLNNQLDRIRSEITGYGKTDNPEEQAEKNEPTAKCSFHPPT